MANNKEDSLTLNIGGIPVKGKLITDLDTGIGKWYPISGPTGPFSASLGNKYLTSTKNTDGTWSGWTPVGDVFGEIRDQNSQISAAYSTSDKVATEFYKSGSGIGSPTGTLNSGRLNQFNAYGAPQTAKKLEIPGTKSTAGITTTQPPAATPTSTDPVPNDPTPITNAEIVSENTRPNGYDDYYYPETLRTTKGQDIIKFTAFSYGGRDLTIEGSSQGNFGSPGLGARKLKTIKGSVTLPIQPSITDNNTVQWGGENLNPLEAFGAAVSYGAQEDIADAAQRTMNAVEKLAKNTAAGDNTAKAFRIFLAGKAVGVNGLLSRTGGGILNPNLELLFQGPQLRPFNFNFRLSPRDEKEAQQVKYIIRFFKENMAVQNTDKDLFLKAPNVFQIRYLLKGDKDHPSLNRIKVCALQSCNVDYTPDGSYMTFNDTNATMTSYGLSLQFQELEPVTSRDYENKTKSQDGLTYSTINLEEIGY
jgi:hypothetical protein